jgi:V/A-type H+-transporting ATPase subunit D
MADKILMNKNSLAALKAELKGYNTALPVFEMKEQQLKKVIQTIELAIERLKLAISNTNEDVKQWVAVMAEETINITDLVNVNELKTEKREIAGVTVERFIDVNFNEIDVDFFTTPLWIDAAIEVVKEQTTNQLMLKIEEENVERVREELAEARRMKNALKEVFIPEAKDNIRKIEIYLGDVERLAIGCAKLVKKKKQNKKALL